MLDIQKYIENGAVRQTKIASDIMYRDISPEELRKIVNDPVIKASFFGEGYKDKIPKEQWTEQYLDLLGCAAIAECFNAEYLYYLNEVAEHVHKKKLEKKIVKWILRVVIPAAGAVGLAGFIWLLAKLI